MVICSGGIPVSAAEGGVHADGQHILPSRAEADQQLILQRDVKAEIAGIVSQDEVAVEPHVTHLETALEMDPGQPSRVPSEPGIGDVKSLTVPIL